MADTNTHTLTHTVLLFSIQTITVLRFSQFWKYKSPPLFCLCHWCPSPNGCWDLLSLSSSTAIFIPGTSPHLVAGATVAVILLCPFLARVFSNIPGEVPSSLGHHPGSTHFLCRMPELQCQRGWCLKPTTQV